MCGLCDDVSGCGGEIRGSLTCIKGEFYILSCHLCDHYKGDDHLMLTAWVYGPLVLVSLLSCITCKPCMHAYT